MGEEQKYAGDGGSIYSRSGLERSVRMAERLVGDTGVLWAWTGRRGASVATSRIMRRLENRRGEGAGVGGADVWLKDAGKWNPSKGRELA
jgi:hypothetical protein